ncbi:hypothetical protein [Kineococcus sp. SYSU DK002]|uniref:hypothetical protein n=1 Tax=Kineococcus sp. SYSU DK002 TaxID=3383123 RepID=UPI003D7E2FEC
MNETSSRHGARVLAEATVALRRHTPTGWQAVRADLLDLARRAHRPSDPVRGRHDLGEFLVATDVLATALRTAVDGVRDVSVTSLLCATDERHTLTGVTVEVVALFGTHLPTAAATVRGVVLAALDDLLGPLSPPEEAVHVHLHVGDVVTDRIDLG